jgi:hypothetical protein
MPIDMGDGACAPVTVAHPKLTLANRHKQTTKDKSRFSIVCPNPIVTLQPLRLTKNYIVSLLLKRVAQSQLGASGTFEILVEDTRCH